MQAVLLMPAGFASFVAHCQVTVTGPVVGAAEVVAVEGAVDTATAAVVTVEALAEKTGVSNWIAAAQRAPADIGLSTIRLGVPERERPRWLRAALLLTDDALPLTKEPPAQSR